MAQRHAIKARQKMPTIDDIGAHRERLAERLARIDAQRLKLVEEIAELEAAERVLSRFTSTQTAPERRGAACSQHCRKRYLGAVLGPATEAPTHAAQRQSQTT